MSKCTVNLILYCAILFFTCLLLLQAYPLCEGYGAAQGGELVQLSASHVPSIEEGLREERHIRDITNVY